jgi:hypothetical protein
MIRTASERPRAVAVRAPFAVPLAGAFAGAFAVALAVPRIASAQAVALRIAPPVGETMRMRLDQRVEMAGTTRLPAGDSTATVVTTLLVISRAFAERRDGDATIVLASTDSVVASSSGADSLVIATEMRRALEGKQVRLRIAADGATEIIGGDAVGSSDLNAVFSQMPATLPKSPVEVGRSWSRVMVAPLAGASARRGGKLQATFRLDSLSRNGDWAYVSLTGMLSRPASAGAGLAVLTMSGSMNGGLVIDRRRGWITDARMTYIVHSVMTPPSGDTAAALRFRMKVTQWMRAER